MFDKFLQNRIKRKLSSYSGLFKICVWISSIVLGLFIIVFVIKPLVNHLSGLPQILLTLIGHQNNTLRDTNGRTNILIMGIGGQDHDGPLLTDTIMLASIRNKDNDVSLITIPRDIWIDPLKGKINEAYALGEAKRKGAGLILAKASLNEIIDVPVHYAFVIDFTAFQEAVDLIGGVDVNVENTFDDFKYPIPGKENDLCGGDPQVKCRYEHLHFDKGWQYMDGQTALKFVRSRYSDGPEGTDFARSKRQIKILMALKSKIVNPKVFLNPKNITDLATKFQSNTTTDLNTSQELFLAKKLINFNPANMHSFSLDTGTDEKPGPLINPPLSSDYDGAWVLVPRGGNWQDIQNKIKQFLQM